MNQNNFAFIFFFHNQIFSCGGGMFFGSGGTWGGIRGGTRGGTRVGTKGGRRGGTWV